jgi:uncharacterized Zn-binding protein involved in type VI secretion
MRSLGFMWAGTKAIGGVLNSEAAQGYCACASAHGTASMPPAARISDMHTCPAFNGPVPHVGGPIIPPCCPTVIVGGMPQARITDMATCVGPPDAIAMGSATVLVGGLQAARIGDPTVHGGVIVTGCPTVIIGG